MTHPSVSAPAVEPVLPGVPAIPLRELAPWAIFMLLLGTVVLFFIGAEQGAFSLISGNAVHEWVHDGRHLLGYPCH